MADSLAVGEHWEKQALEHLLAKGLEPIEENFRCRMGEIDLIMLEGDCLVFIEVRYRRHSRFATAAESVDGMKQRKLIRTAAAYLANNPQYHALPVRFDVIAIEDIDTPRAHYEWIKGAFDADSAY